MSKYKLYTNSKRAWDGMLKAMKLAQKSIYIEMFILLADTSETHDFWGVIKEKAKKGVKIAIVADSFGSYALDKEAVNEARALGVEILFFSDWLRRTHRKIIIVDEKIAFLGGVNIEKKTINWRDLQVRLESKYLDKVIFKSFAYTYIMCGGKDPFILKQQQKKFFHKVHSWLLEHWPNSGVYALNNYYREKIIAAQKRIVIITPYFTPPRWLVALLDDAIRRGVKVEVIIPENTDVSIINRVNYGYIRLLSHLGIEFFLFKKMNHAKALFIDNKELMIGSPNIDFLSFNFNLEVGVFMDDKELIQEFSLLVEKWQRQSWPLAYLKNKLIWLDYVFAFFIRLFLRML